MSRFLTTKNKLRFTIRVFAACLLFWQMHLLPCAANAADNVPSQPQNFKAVWVDNEICLSWTDSDHGDMWYSVLRSKSPQGPFFHETEVFIKGQRPNQTIYDLYYPSDTPWDIKRSANWPPKFKDGEASYYAVRVFNSARKEGPPSSMVRATSHYSSLAAFSPINQSSQPVFTPAEAEQSAVNFCRRIGVTPKGNPTIEFPSPLDDSTAARRNCSWEIDLSGVDLQLEDATGTVTFFNSDSAENKESRDSKPAPSEMSESQALFLAKTFTKAAKEPMSDFNLASAEEQPAEGGYIGSHDWVITWTPKTYWLFHSDDPNTTMLLDFQAGNGTVNWFRVPDGDPYVTPKDKLLSLAVVGGPICVIGLGYAFVRRRKRIASKQ